jgi:hypothetical protein
LFIFAFFCVSDDPFQLSIQHLLDTSGSSFPL